MEKTIDDLYNENTRLMDEIEWLEEERQYCYDPTRQIAIVWDITDVMEVRGDLTANQCLDVLKTVLENHNADIGVCWDTIKETADSIYPRRQA